MPGANELVSAEYDVAYIGRSLDDDGLNSIKISTADLIDCRGEIGDFTLSYLDDGQLKECKAANIVINLSHQYEISEEFEKSCQSLIEFSVEELNQENFTENKNDNTPLIIIQDYPELSPAVLSKIGLKKVLEVKEKYPDREVYYFYQALRFMEDNDQLYKEARQKEIIFLKYDPDNLLIDNSGQVNYQREDIELELTGRLVIAPELKPAAGLEQIAEIFNITTDDEGYLQVDNIYLQPTLSGKRGVYVLKGARGVNALTCKEEEREYTLKEIKNNLQGVNELDQEERNVDDQKCILCYTCYRLCPHGAIQRDDELNSMQIMSLACQSCNLCLSSCPMEAIERSGEKEKQPEDKKQVIICENSAAIARKKAESDPLLDWMVTEVPCVSTVRKEHIYQRLQGDNELLILGCIAEACKHLTGHDHCELIINKVKEDLEKLDLDPKKVTYKRLSPRMAADLSAYLQQWKEGNGQ